MKYTLSDLVDLHAFVASECGEESAIAAVLRAARLGTNGRIVRQATDPILHATCQHFEITPAELVGGPRTDRITRARMVAAYLLCSCGVGLREVARLLGRKSHGNIPEWGRRVDELPELRADAAAVARLAGMQFDDAAVPVVLPREARR
jgi:chromosomal replication initiation ATPase DnaA